MGLYDDVSNIKMIKEHTGVEKVFFVGYSQGTIQMLYGLAHLEKEFHADNLYKAVLLAPCFYVDLAPTCDTFECLEEYPLNYQNLGVYAYNGPNWNRDKMTLCNHYGLLYCMGFTRALKGT